MKLGFEPIRVCTTVGQSGTPPDPKVTLVCVCAKSQEFVVLVTLHALRPFLCYCTVCKSCHSWCEWARKEIKHILGFVTDSTEKVSRHDKR